MSPSHDVPSDWDLTEYVAGRAAGDVVRTVERWMEANPAHCAEVELVREAWRAADSSVPAFDASAERVAWKKLTEQIGRRGTQSFAIDGLSPLPQTSHRAARMAGGATVKKLFGGWPRRDPGQHSLFRTVGFGVAAGAVFLGVAGLSWFAGQAYRTHRRAPTIVAAAREVVAPRGERAALDLADGTRIILAPESRLRIPAAYQAGTGTRDLELDGEASFEVIHDATRPFRVHTAVGVAEDLGTRFVVTAYRDTRNMRVVVASGEVGIHSRFCSPSDQNPHSCVDPNSRPLALLQQGDLARLDSLGMVTLRHNIDTRRYFAWTAGRLVFDGTPLREAIAALNRWYDVDLRVGDPAIAARPLTVTFNGGSVQNVVRQLELMLDTRAEWQGRVVTLYARQAAAPQH